MVRERVLEEKASVNSDITADKEDRIVHGWVNCLCQRKS